MYDTKDIKIIAQVINAVAPVSPRHRAMLVVEAAVEAGVLLDEIHAVVQILHERKYGASI